jgi:hypothetical protein
MRYWNFRRALFSGTVILVMVMALGLIGCSDDDDDDDQQVVVDLPAINLTAANAAALGGLTFDFPDATIFGFPGESAELTFGPDGTTFVLVVSEGTIINGAITFPASCQFTEEEPGTFEELYDTCQMNVQSDGEISLGGEGDGTVVLRLGLEGQAAVSSDPPLAVTLSVDEDGNVSLNGVIIGRVTGTGGTGS